ncbi:MAG: hypothetical protein CMD27_01750 [Flavobacteriales bacterium]|nr:hypothetical protein [Flavobacteriales bacterium]
MNNKNNQKYSFIVICIGILALYFVDRLNNSKYQYRTKLDHILQEVQKNYVDSIDMGSLIESSIEQTLKNLDPHSIYMTKDQVASSMEMMQGSFEGIGVEFSIQNDTIIVINVIPDGPSEKIGIKAGDRIVTIEDKNVTGIGITNQDVIKQLRGEGGTYVKVGINRKRNPEISIFNIKRGEIPIHSLDVAYEIAPKVGYIKLNRFAETTHNEFKTQLKHLIDQYHINNLILDLRGNGGGYLDQAIKILNEFFSNGELLVYTEGHSRKIEKYRANFFGLYKNGGVCVLIDEDSASASEIIAGAIQDHERGIIIGRKSFGKGLVQEQIPLSDGSLIRLTVSRYYTPLGRCIQKPYSYDKDIYGNSDSKKNLHIDTLQQFFTKSGKTVYGGGGITPDEIIDEDEEVFPASLLYLYTSNFFNDLAFEYVDTQRSKLDNLHFNNFSLSKSEKEIILKKIQKWILKELADIYLEEKLKEDLRKEEIKILNRITALIIRQYWGWGEMQMFLNENDKIILRSLSLLKT